MWGMGWGMWMFPLLMLLTFLVFAGIFVFGRGWRGNWHHGGPPWHMMDGPAWKDPTHSALQILNERYARGEIEKSEYEERKATILSGKAP
jgi:putative membrane protein